MNSFYYKAEIENQQNIIKNLEREIDLYAAKRTVIANEAIPALIKECGEYEEKENRAKEQLQIATDVLLELESNG